MADMERDEGSADVERVLRAVGSRPRPPDDAVRTARAAVHAEWQAVVAARGEQRARRRRWSALATAAGVAALALTLWVARPQLIARGAVVGTVARTVGASEREAGVLRPAQALAAGDVLRVGDEVTTGRTSRVALVLGDGASLRLDRDTHIELAADDRVHVSRGAVYVDAGPPGAVRSRLRIETPIGSVRHLGTQYEVRLLGAVVQVRVREGRVQVDRGAGPSLEAAAGEQLRVSGAGQQVARGTIAPHAPEWGWVAAAAPGFDIGGRPLVEFLEWAGRELGREIVFASPQAEAAAATTVLSGSVAGLSPQEALAAVLPATALHWRAESGGRLVIESARR